VDLEKTNHPMHCHTNQRTVHRVICFFKIHWALHIYAQYCLVASCRFTFDDMQHPYLYNYINSIICWKSIYCWLGLPPFIAQNQPLKLPRQCLPGSIIHGLSYQPLASLRNHESPAVKQKPHLTIRPNLGERFSISSLQLDSTISTTI
jgi:hypothetical protein